MYLCMYVCIYLCMYVCMYLCMYVCMYVYMYVCMYVRTYIYIYTYIYIHIYIHIYIYIHIHIHIYIYTYTYTYTPTPLFIDLPNCWTYLKLISIRFKCESAPWGIFMWHARFDITCEPLVEGYNHAIWAGLLVTCADSDAPWWVIKPLRGWTSIFFWGGILTTFNNHLTMKQPGWRTLQSGSWHLAGHSWSSCFTSASAGRLWVLLCEAPWQLCRSHNITSRHVVWKIMLIIPLLHWVRSGISSENRIE